VIPHRQLLLLLFGTELQLALPSAKESTPALSLARVATFKAFYALAANRLLTAELNECYLGT
jgi:hypothetical protein